MKKLEGWTTLIGNVVLFLVFILSMAGVDLSEAEAETLTAAIIVIASFIFNIVNRFRTKGPVGKKIP